MGNQSQIHKYIIL